MELLHFLALLVALSLGLRSKQRGAKGFETLLTARVRTDAERFGFSFATQIKKIEQSVALQSKIVSRTRADASTEASIFARYLTCLSLHALMPSWVV